MVTLIVTGVTRGNRPFNFRFFCIWVGTYIYRRRWPGPRGYALAGFWPDGSRVRSGIELAGADPLRYPSVRVCWAPSDLINPTCITIDWSGATTTTVVQPRDSSGRAGCSLAACHLILPAVPIQQGDGRLLASSRFRSPFSVGNQPSPLYPAQPSAVPDAQVP
jgi:hypothetical protein